MDPLITVVAEKAASAATTKLVLATLNLGWRRIKWLPTTLTRRDDKVRVVCSAFLRVQNKNGKYLLIRNLHRPEFFAPIGGCYKYLAAAKPYLDQVLFSQDTLVRTGESAMDIRGYIRRRHVADFFKWFSSNNSTRETSRECLIREISEELFVESKLAQPKDINLSGLEFRYVRSYLEKSRINDTSTIQFRFFEVYDFCVESEASQALLKYLTTITSKNLQWVDEKDINIGRTNGNRTIGHAAVLLINDKLTRPDGPLPR